MDLAVDINAHLATAVLGEAPETARQSFDLATTAGVLSAELAEEMAPATGLRNVLVHRYVDIDAELVASSVGRLVDLLPRYIREVAAYVENLDQPQAPGASS